MGLIRTLWTSKSNVTGSVNTTTFIAHKGEIWYDNDIPELRYSDGLTPGGIPLFGSGGGSSYTLIPATTSTLGGIKVGNNLSISPDGTLSAVSSATSLMPATTSTLGGIKVGNNLSVTPDGTLNASSSTADTFSTVKVTGQPDLNAIGRDILEFLAGAGIIINTSTTPNKTITIENDMFNAVIDGGTPNSIYGGLPIVDGGGI